MLTDNYAEGFLTQYDQAQLMHEALILSRLLKEIKKKKFTFLSVFDLINCREPNGKPVRALHSGEENLNHKM